MIIKNDLVTNFGVPPTEHKYSVKGRSNTFSSITADNMYEGLFRVGIVVCSKKSFKMNKYYRALQKENPKYQVIADTIIKIVRVSRQKEKVTRDKSVRIDGNEAMELIQEDWFGIDSETGHYYIDHIPEQFRLDYMMTDQEIKLMKQKVCAEDLNKVKYNNDKAGKYMNALVDEVLCMFDDIDNITAGILTEQKIKQPDPQKTFAKRKPKQIN